MALPIDSSATTPRSANLVLNFSIPGNAVLTRVPAKGAKAAAINIGNLVRTSTIGPVSTTDNSFKSIIKSVNTFWSFINSLGDLPTASKTLEYFSSTCPKTSAVTA